MQLREVALTRTPFTVKGGGHTLNPRFSSTFGVHISLAKFKDIVIHKKLGDSGDWRGTYLGGGLRVLSPQGHQRCWRSL